VRKNNNKNNKSIAIAIGAINAIVILIIMINVGSTLIVVRIASRKREIGRRKKERRVGLEWGMEKFLSLPQFLFIFLSFSI
jgi:hypothetical protein